MSTANRGKVAHGGTKSKSYPRSKSGGGQGHEGGGEGGHNKNMANKLGMHAAGQREKKKETQLMLQSKMRVTQLTRQLQKAEDDLRDYLLFGKIQKFLPNGTPQSVKVIFPTRVSHD